VAAVPAAIRNNQTADGISTEYPDLTRPCRSVCRFLPSAIPFF